MIVALMVLAGCLLIIASAFVALGLWAALLAAGVSLLAGAVLVNEALREAQKPPQEA